MVNERFSIVADEAKALLATKSDNLLHALGRRGSCCCGKEVATAWVVLLLLDKNTIMYFVSLGSWRAWRIISAVDKTTECFVFVWALLPVAAT